MYVEIMRHKCTRIEANHRDPHYEGGGGGGGGGGVDPIDPPPPPPPPPLLCTALFLASCSACFPGIVAREYTLINARTN